MPRDKFEEFDSAEELDADTEESDEVGEADLDEEEEDWEGEEDTDGDVADIFNEAQNLDFGREDLNRKLKTYTNRNPKLTGGDIDASWEYADVGEEAVGGQNPTPDQSNVDEIGEAMGIVYEDDEPIETDDKLEKRDKHPWELNPESAGKEFAQRVKQEFDKPLDRTTKGERGKRESRNTQAPAKPERNAPAGRRVQPAQTTRPAAAAGNQENAAASRGKRAGVAAAQRPSRATRGSQRAGRTGGTARAGSRRRTTGGGRTAKRP